MADHGFVTHWQFAAPLERVWREVAAMDRSPEWRSFVVRLELLEPGDADDIGPVRPHHRLLRR